ncbi:MAG: TldD/PmbA family protein, partial [Chloroflexota bacterium]|nr:TldD/PmbA family protein [Chloroflexota bacterium]
LTGMTRDGTFWVERGEVQFPIKNLRFSQSVLQALRGVQGIGRQVKAQRGWFGATAVPALKLGVFRFTGATEF